VERVVDRRSILDYILRQMHPLAALKGNPDILRKLDTFRRRTE